MKYLIIDACSGGTGIRDKYEGGYINPEELMLSESLTDQIRLWLSAYENEHYNGFINHDIVTGLDAEGVEKSGKIKDELINIKIEYFSAATMTCKLI